MKIHNIDLSSLIPFGQVVSSVADNELQMTSTSAIYTHFHNNDTPIKSYIGLPNKYKLPFRIDLTIKIDSPAFYLMIGNGHVEFATGSAHRGITDILGNDFKPNMHIFDNNININEFADISVTFGNKFIYIAVNGVCRCLSKKSPYIKMLQSSELPDEFKNGFDMAIACNKRTQLTVKNFVITEFEDCELEMPSDIPNIQPINYILTEKPTLEAAIQKLSSDLQKEILSIDEFLMQNMKKSLKLKRKIENWSTGGRITYVSDFGFRYKIEILETYMWHDIGWIAYNTKRETEKFGGRKKADYTNEILLKLSEHSPEFANEMFMRVNECKRCNLSENCNNIWTYEHNGKQKISCVWDGGMNFKMIPSDFADVKKVIEVINEILVKIQ